MIERLMNVIEHEGDHIKMKNEIIFFLCIWDIVLVSFPILFGFIYNKDYVVYYNLTSLQNELL